MWVAGEWRDARNPTMEEAKKVEGETQTLGYGEFADRTYVEVLANNPKYV